ncbi:hypothetical protein Q7C36_001153 [Tachysurus vachellii]|uniref:Ig-like domain-containing protein n=1 Tax=Tachysurus vachellii TaxID=175792 RepID=A0AA88T8T4_TACVA|nr:hypothetical protein Q7C36_001153 [Tachysurus vachellii]
MASVLCVLLQFLLCSTAVFSLSVKISPMNPLFRVGDREEITCQADQCTGKMTFSWQNLEDKPLNAYIQMFPNKTTLLYKRVQKHHEYSVVCKLTCQGKSKEGKVKIQVYSFPNDPVVSGHDNLVLGKENTVTCKVSDVYPAELMTVEWLRGGNVVYTQEGEHGIKSIQSKYTFKPQLNDTGELIMCRVTLNLDNLPPERRTRETTVSMAVLSPPLLVSLQPNSSFIRVERGSSMTLFCNSSGCPHSHITWKNETHQPRLSRTADSEVFVSQLGPWTVGLEDNRTFICEVQCGSVVKSKHTEIKVYSFPSDPAIEISGPIMEGKVTNLTCTVHNIFPVDCFHMQWMYGELELQSVRGNFSEKLQNLSLTIPIKPKDSDQNKTFTCKVSLKIGKQDWRLQKTANTTLAVKYSPKNTTIDVRPQKQLNEGETVTISCQTASYPEGHVTLSRVWNGEETKLVSSNGTQTSFSISYTNVLHSGIYVCEAVNRYGQQREMVQITVQAPPRNINVTVYPSNTVQEGETITVCCQYVSFPPSEITLRKLDNGSDIYSSNGTFLLVNLTANSSGLYQVTATNALGSENKIFTINVTSKNIESPLLKRINSTDFIIPVIGLGVLATVLSTLDYIRRAKRKGFYELTEGIP